jgi:hypothetical protein
MNHPMAKNNNIDIMKKQLEKLDDFLETLQVEAKTLDQYCDMGPARALYAHIRELIKDLMNTKNFDDFDKKMLGLNQAVAGILIVIMPAKAASVQKNMQKAHGKDFDPTDLNELVKNMNANMDMTPSNSPTPPDDDDDNPIADDDEPEVNNDPDEIIRLLNLEDKVKRKSKPNDPDDTLGSVFNNY